MTTAATTISTSLSKVNARIYCHNCSFKRIVENAIYVLPNGFAWDTTLNLVIEEHLEEFPDHTEIRVSYFKNDNNE